MSDTPGIGMNVLLVHGAIATTSVLENLLDETEKRRRFLARLAKR